MCPPRYHHNGFVATNSCTWAYNLRLHIAGINEPKSAQKARPGACYK